MTTAHVGWENGDFLSATYPDHMLVRHSTTNYDLVTYKTTTDSSGATVRDAVIANYGPILQPAVHGIKQAALAVDTTTVIMARFASQPHILIPALEIPSLRWCSHSTMPTTHCLVTSITWSAI